MSEARKVAVVTGGGRGIGRGCALGLASHGFDIVLVDLMLLSASVEFFEKRIEYYAGAR